MLKNNKINMLIAFVLAISLWAYVLETTKVASTETIRNVPVNYINEAALQEEQLVVLNKGADTINIVVSGERSLISKIKTRDFKVVCDLSLVQLGENTLPVAILEYPESVKIESISDKYVNISVDKYKETYKPVKAVAKMELNENQEMVIQEVGLEKVLVKGPETLVDKVYRVNAVFKGKELNKEAKQAEAKLIPVNKKGEEVEGVDLSEYRTIVKAKLFRSKTVPLFVSITGMDEQLYEYGISKPDHITISGENDVVNNIERVDSSISLAGIIKSSKLFINPILPQGVFVSGSQGPLYVEVKISPKGEDNGPTDVEKDKEKDKPSKPDTSIDEEDVSTDDEGN